MKPPSLANLALLRVRFGVSSARFVGRLGKKGLCGPPGSVHGHPIESYYRNLLHTGHLRSIRGALGCTGGERRGNFNVEKTSDLINDLNPVYGFLKV